MTPPPSVTRTLARQILAGPAVAGEASGHQAGRVVRACEQLRVPLTRLAGHAGFSALLSRALVLAKRHDPSLEGLRVSAAGSLEGLPDDRPGGAGGGDVWAGGVTFVAELIGLLVTLIGGPLTVVLLRQAWPGMPMPDLSAGTEESL